MLNSIISGLFKLFLFVMALVFFAGLLVLLLLSLVFALVRWLFTGRPPQVKVTNALSKYVQGSKYTFKVGAVPVPCRAMLCHAV